MPNEQKFVYNRNNYNKIFEKIRKKSWEREICKIINVNKIKYFIKKIVRYVFVRMWFIIMNVVDTGNSRIPLRFPLFKKKREESEEP